MKKGAVASLVLACITFVLSISMIILSFRSAMAPVSIEHFTQGISMRMSFSSSMGLAISSISVMMVILGSALLISSLILLCLSIALFYFNKEQKAVIHHKTELKEAFVTKQEQEIIDQQLEKI